MGSVLFSGGIIVYAPVDVSSFSVSTHVFGYIGNEAGAGVVG